MSARLIATVVIVNRNGKDLLTECLRAVHQQSVGDIDVVVVDNGSTDGSVEQVQRTFPTVRVIPLRTNIGFAAANNLALREAKGEYIALLNNDTVADPRWLEHMVATMERRREIDSCASRMLLYSDTSLLDGCGDFYTVEGIAGKIGHRESADQYQEERLVFGASAGASVYRRKMLEDVGLFDEDFFIVHEDTDLNFRAQLRGHSCLYVPSSVVLHHSSASIGKRSHLFFYHAHRNSEYVYLKNMPGPLLLKYSAVHLLADALLLLLSVRRGQARPFLAAKRDALLNARGMWAKRRHIQKGMAVPVSTLERVLERGWIERRLRELLAQSLRKPVSREGAR